MHGKVSKHQSGMPMFDMAEIHSLKCCSIASKYLVYTCGLRLTAYLHVSIYYVVSVSRQGLGYPSREDERYLPQGNSKRVTGSLTY